MLYEQYIMRGEAFLLDTRARTVVDDTIRAVCVRRHWELHALNVRTNHVHAAVSAHFAPEPVMTAFKAWATRELVAAGGAAQGRKVWTRHGSTRYLWNEEDLWAAVNYIENGQGEDLPRSWPKRQPAADRSLPVAAQSETPGDHDV